MKIFICTHNSTFNLIQMSFWQKNEPIIGVDKLAREHRSNWKTLISIHVSHSPKRIDFNIKWWNTQNFKNFIKSRLFGLENMVVGTKIKILSVLFAEIFDIKRLQFSHFRPFCKNGCYSPQRANSIGVQLLNKLL